MRFYPFSKIEKKWQKFWEKEKVFATKESPKKQKFYCLDMFPYPSAEGLHVGHFRGYTFSDVFSKKRKMEGFNVLHPMGFDAFGLPAENFAIKTKIPPQITTKKAIHKIRQQLKRAGLGYDWEREIITCKPEYYKFTQWMFLTLYKAGLAYKKMAPVNFCSCCKTVLAREQVIEGKCERCKSDAGKREMEQWFFKITAYAERLLEDLEKIDWPENIKTMQRNWIGKSEGVEINFEILNSDLKINVFTTRIDTIFGCTFLVLAPENLILEQLKEKISNWKEIEKYIKEAKQKTEIERMAENRKKTGIKVLGIEAKNPLTEKRIPIFVSDYVLGEYGTGAVMGVPAHDQRDFVFAKEHNLEIVWVIKGKEEIDYKNAFEEEGILINSGPFSGLESKKAKEEITKYLQRKGLGKKAVYYKLRDWCISRQRYWGAPIPIVYCKKCGIVPIPEKNLPVILPKIKDFLPTGDGKSPLAKVKKFVKTKCPKCKGEAERETDTMDTFVCSSWYFLRYVDPKNEKVFADKRKIKKFLPVDLYVGGAEHAVMHLLYARFFTKVLKDLGYLDFDEPFLKLFNQGTIYYKGTKMSKSKGNVVDPEYIFEKYGADTLRMYEMFMGPSDQAIEWSDKGILGVFRFLNKVWNLTKKVSKKENPQLERLWHKTLKKVEEDIENFKFNTAISSLMTLCNAWEKEKEIPKNIFIDFVKTLSIFAPHLGEELYRKLTEKKSSVFLEKFPRYDPQKVLEEKIILLLEVNGKLRDKLEVQKDIPKEEAEKLARENEKLKKFLEGKKVEKVVFVPNKLINFVVK
jgi:leucyl-tRNA synthetase